MIGKASVIIIVGLGIRSLPPKTPEDFSHLDSLDRVVYREAVVNGQDPHHMYATFAVESKFNKDALNPRTKAKGCGQLMPSTIKKLGLSEKEAGDCSKNIEASSRWFSKGSEEIKSKDPKKLSQWYYCGINLYGKIIFDKDLKKREVCGTTYSNKVMAKMSEIKKEKSFNFNS